MKTDRFGIGRVDESHNLHDIRHYHSGNFTMDFIMQREAPFSGNEYWFKFFPLYKQTGSLRWVHFDNIELNTATMRSSLVHPNSKIETSEIKRTANPYGWLALGGTVMTAVAAATYGYLKWFKSDAK